jgi:hypothetical protein
MTRSTKAKLWIETEKPPQLAQGETVTLVRSGAGPRRKGSSMAEVHVTLTNDKSGNSFTAHNPGQRPLALGAGQRVVAATKTWAIRME